MKEVVGEHFKKLKDKDIDQVNIYKQFEVKVARENIGAIWAVFAVHIDAGKGIYDLEYLEFKNFQKKISKKMFK